MVGEKFGRLTILSEAKKRSSHRLVNVVCDCGATKVVQLGNLRSGHTKSCGCLNSEVAAKRKLTHAQSKIPEYYVWNTMRSRCNNINNASFKDYGGRGIGVCDRWNKFENFIQDMGFRPSPKHEIDRHPNNDGNYEPSNCRWVTRAGNAQNKRNSVKVIYGGRAIGLREASNLSGIKYGTLSSRMARGISLFKELSKRK